MTTSVDITNRALQLLGTRTTVASLAENSNEAIQANLVYQTVTDWCHAMANWNFARKQASLGAAVKSSPASGTWNPATMPPTPWLFEFTLPSDFIKAHFITNNAIGTLLGNPSFLGEPKRFVVVTDTISSVQQEVLLSNETTPSLIYTSRVSDPTLWTAYFERFAVAALARTMCMALTGNIQLMVFLEELMQDYFTAAETTNRSEGLVVDDTTPEWIQALGVPYPYRRYLPIKPFPKAEPQQQQRQQNDQRR